ncbi:unnamed protein product [Adineta steineri]|nr:unnamed protein product [Adineta steineri]
MIKENIAEQSGNAKQPGDAKQPDNAKPLDRYNYNISFGGVLLEDDKTLKHYEIGKNSVLTLEITPKVISAQ